MLSSNQTAADKIFVIPHAPMRQMFEFMDFKNLMRPYYDFLSPITSYIICVVLDGCDVLRYYK
jgi:hypothetical protein